MRKLVLFFFIGGFVGCAKEKHERTNSLKSLYLTYKNGEITECLYNGRTVYLASFNVKGSNSTIYDDDGNVIGDCSYAWGNSDPICKNLQITEIIYRVKDHISTLPAIDKYKLSQ